MSRSSKEDVPKTEVGDTLRLRRPGRLSVPKKDVPKAAEVVARMKERAEEIVAEGRGILDEAVEEGRKAAAEAAHGSIIDSFGPRVPAREGNQFLEALGGAELLAAEESQFKEDGKFVRLHFVELVKQYPEQWIAVYRGKVVAADKELQALASKLRLEGFPLSRVVLEYMTEKKVVRVL